jgi:DNA polymerase-3 subunit gamma/tau
VIAHSHDGRAQALQKPQEVCVATPQTLEEIVALLEQEGRFQLASLVKHHVRLIRLSNGRLEYSQNEHAPTSLASDLTQTLKALTNQRWVVIHNSSSEGQPSLAEQEQAAIKDEIEAAKQNPLVHEVLQYFPEAKIKRIIDVAPNTGKNEH